MKREILIILTALWAVPAAAADSGHCDSKPFTLKKPAAVQPQAAPPVPAPKPKAMPVVQPRKTAAKAKPKYVIGCKQPKN